MSTDECVIALFKKLIISRIPWFVKDTMEVTAQFDFYVCGLRPATYIVCLINSL